MVSTKLLNVRTLQLEQYDISSLPPYLAISHVWADELYPPECLHSITETQPLGMQMVMSAFEHEDLQNVHYCWIDSWSIDQNDDVDKKSQIPQMDKIYRKAQAMAITVKHEFSFSQQDWNNVTDELQNDINWFHGSERSGDDYEIYAQKHQNFRANQRANQAMDYITEIAGLDWNRRIWTAQEFILAQNAFWVDGKLKRLQADSSNMNAIHELFIHAGSTDKNRSNSQILNNLHYTNSFRLGHMKFPELMLLARYRDSQHKTDQIYGLMAASEVIITPKQDEFLSGAWRRWWEAAIKEDHLLFAVLPTFKDLNISYFDLAANCIMPSVEVRTECIGRARIENVQPMGSLMLNQGTVKAWGRREGTVKIELCLGKDAELPSVVADLLGFYKQSSGVTERFLLAMSASYDNSRKLVARIMQRLQYLALFSARNDISEQPIRDEVDAIYEFWFTELRAKFSREFPGNLYLGTLNTGKQKIDILIPATDPIPQGKLLAIDFNVFDVQESETDRPERKCLMIVLSPEQTNSTRQALHKVNMAIPIRYWRSEELYEGYGHQDIAIWSNGGPIRQFSIGGDACLYCKSCKEGSNNSLEIPNIWDVSEHHSVPNTKPKTKRPAPSTLPSRYSKRIASISGLSV